MFRRLSIAFLFLTAALTGQAFAQSQHPIVCAPSVNCPLSTAANGAADPEPVAYGKINTDIAWLFANSGGGGGGASLSTPQTWTALQTFGTNISIGGVTVTGATGTGNNVFATSPTLVTPNLGVPSFLTLTNATGLPIATGVSGLASGMATFLATPTSANLAATVTNETGTGNLVFSTSPTFVTPTLGAALATTINGNTFTSGTYTLTGSAGKTLTFSNSLTLAGTDATTMTFPATSGTVATLNSIQTVTAAKTFTNSDLLLLGSSTGYTTFTSANASATNYTLTIPAGTGTAVVAGINGCNESGSTAGQVCTSTGASSTPTFQNPALVMSNALASATSITPSCAAEWNAGTITVATGTFTVNAPTGCTPAAGQKLTLDLNTTNVQTFAWNAAFCGGATALPTATTGGGKEDLIGFRYSTIKACYLYVAASMGY